MYFYADYGIFISINWRSSSQKVTSCHARKYSRGWTAASKWLKFKPWLYWILAVWPWATYIISLWISVLGWNMETYFHHIILVIMGQDWWVKEACSIVSILGRIAMMSSSPHPLIPSVPVLFSDFSAEETSHTKAYCPHLHCFNHWQSNIPHTLARKGTVWECDIRRRRSCLGMKGEGCRREIAEATNSCRSHGQTDEVWLWVTQSEWVKVSRNKKRRRGLLLAHLSGHGIEERLYSSWGKLTDQISPPSVFTLHHSDEWVLQPWILF